MLVSAHAVPSDRAGAATSLRSLRERLRHLRVGAAQRPLLLGPPLTDVHMSRPDLASALRRAADAIVATQRAIVEAGADLVAAPTAGTTAPALHATGQAYRAAALTAAAVDLTRDAVFASGRDAAVVGEVLALAGQRARRGSEEARLHVERLATSAVDAILVMVEDVEIARDAVAAAIEHRLPVLVEVELARLAQTLGSLMAVTSGGALPTAIVLRGDDAATLAEGVATARAVCPTQVFVGARFVPRAQERGERSREEDAQLAVAEAWSLLAPLGLAVLGLGGPAAMTALPALVDLVDAPRVSLPG